MPKKQKAESEQLSAKEITPVAAPSKKTVPARSKSAAATHKAPAKHASKPGEPPVAEVVQDVKAPAAATSVTTPVVAAPAPERKVVPTAASREEEIARLAYSYFEARGYEHGHAIADWVRAEQEYEARFAPVKG